MAITISQPERDRPEQKDEKHEGRVNLATGLSEREYAPVGTAVRVGERDPDL